ncbi:MAG: hypothetical protein U0169_25070 [Polyangiaceae bacterium]
MSVRLPPKPSMPPSLPPPSSIPAASSRPLSSLPPKASRFPAPPSSRPVLPPLHRDDDEKTMVKIPTPRPSAPGSSLAPSPVIPAAARVPSFRPVPAAAPIHAPVADLSGDDDGEYNDDDRTMLRPGMGRPTSSSRLPALPPISPGSMRAAPQTGSAVIPMGLRDTEGASARELAAPATVRPVTLAPAHRYPHLAKTMPVSGRSSEVGSAVITTRTHVLAGGRPTMSWFAAIMATGVFLGLLSAVIARGDSDALLDATAAFVDPAHTARAASAQPATMALQGSIAMVGQGQPAAPGYAVAASAPQTVAMNGAAVAPANGNPGVDADLAQRLPPGFVQSPQAAQPVPQAPQIAAAQPVAQAAAPQAWGYAPAPVANPNAVQPQAVQQPVAQAPVAAAPRAYAPVYRAPAPRVASPAPRVAAAPPARAASPVTASPAPAPRSGHDDVAKSASDELSRMLLERSL